MILRRVQNCRILLRRQCSIRQNRPHLILGNALAKLFSRIIQFGWSVPFVINSTGMKSHMCNILTDHWSGEQLCYYLCSIWHIFSFSEYLESGCVPRDPNLSALRSYSGTFLEKVSSFRTEYCSHLASSNCEGFDADRLQSLQQFLLTKGSTVSDN